MESSKQDRAPQEADKFIIRLPEGMRDTLKARAAGNNRSMNAEIVAILGAAVSESISDQASPKMTELLAQILDATRRASAVVVPVEVDLWDTEHIGAYLKRSANRVRNEIVSLPTFPPPIRLPVHGKAQALYKARDVIKWAESHATEAWPRQRKGAGMSRAKDE